MALEAVSLAAAQRGDGPCVRPDVGGDLQVEVPFAGTAYSVLVYVPEGLRPTRRVPLLLNLHGSQANGAYQMDLSGMRAVADDGRLHRRRPERRDPDRSSGRSA